MLLFAMGAYTLLQQSIATRQMERHFEGAQRLHFRKIAEGDRALYKASKAVKKGGKEGPKRVAKKGGTFESPRTQFNLPENAKLNISPLFSKDKPDPLLRKVTLSLLDRLYEPTAAYRKGFEEELLDAMIKAGIENPKIDSFADLFSKLEGDFSSYYKFLKGTQNYTLFTNIGYPAIGDFLTLQTERKPILLASASKPLLIALFGDRFANELLLKEAENWNKEGKHVQIKKEEIEALFIQHGPTGKNLSDFESLLDYKNREKHLEQQVYLDQKSKIQLRIR